MADEYPTEADKEVLRKLGLLAPTNTPTKKDEE
jgi:hypothetical protein